MIKTISAIKDEALKATLQTLYTLLNSPDRYTLESLSRKLNYDTEIVFNVIKYALDIKIYDIYLGNLQINANNIQYVLVPQSKEKLSIVSKTNIVDENYHESYYMLFFDYFNFAKKRKDLLNKVSFHLLGLSDNENDSEIVNFAQKLFSEKKTTKFETKDGSEVFYPLAIYSNRTSSQEYLVSVSQDDIIRMYPADKIRCLDTDSGKYVKIQEKYSDEGKIEKVFKYLADLWAPQDIKLSEVPIWVKAIIHDESCVYKIRHDVSNRKGRVTENGDGTYTLELEVLGYDSFRSWVLSYGSSIEIKTPLNLREDIKKTYKEIRDKYSSV